MARRKAKVGSKNWKEEEEIEREKGMTNEKKVQGLDRAELLQWIQQKNPKLLGEDDDLEKFKAARIDGDTFLEFGHDMEFFRKASLPIGVCAGLVILARKARQEAGPEEATVGGSKNAGFPEQSNAAFDLDLTHVVETTEHTADPKTAKRKGPPHTDMMLSPKRTRVGDSSQGPRHIGPSMLAREMAGEGMVGIKRIGKQTEDVEMVEAASQWEEFINRARTLYDNGEEDIDTEESDSFPEDNDPTLHEACEALSKALQDASKAMETHDNAEVKQAVDNLRKAYNDAAARSEPVTIRYIDVKVPAEPYSPLGEDVQRTILAQPWIMELISRLSDKSFPRRLVVIGNPGIGKSVALVGYLLFYLITQGQRVILQSVQPNWCSGLVFDNSGVHEVSGRDALMYNDGKPCYLLVSADGPDVYPSPEFGFCNRTIVVTSPNLPSKKGLRNWIKQVKAKQFVAPRPSYREVVFLLSRIQNFDRSIVYWMYREWTRDFRRCESDCEGAISHLNEGTLSQWYQEKQQHLTNLIEGMLLGGQGPNEAHQIRDTRTNMAIPSALVNLERRNERTDVYKITFATRRIAQLVAKVQRGQKWKNNWETMTLFFNNAETRVAAGELFQRMFLWKFRKQHPNTMPKCYELRSNDGPHPLSNSASPAPMPWDDLDQQPTLEWISVGKDADGSLYSKKELKNAIDAVNLESDDPQAIRFLIPCAQNWASWDAALFIGKHRTNGVDIHIVLLQLTINRKHDILAKGLNQVKDAIGRKPARVQIHYHYILVLLTHDDDVDRLNIPRWRPVLNNSKERKSVDSWKNLREYIMFVPLAELIDASLED